MAHGTWMTHRDVSHQLYGIFACQTPSHPLRCHPNYDHITGFPALLFHSPTWFVSPNRSQRRIEKVHCSLEMSVQWGPASCRKRKEKDLSWRVFKIDAHTCCEWAIKAPYMGVSGAIMVVNMAPWLIPMAIKALKAICIRDLGKHEEWQMWYSRVRSIHLCCLQDNFSISELINFSISLSWNGIACTSAPKKAKWQVNDYLLEKKGL